MLAHFSITAAQAQASKQPFVAPFPPGIAAAKTVFLSNAGIAPDLRNVIESSSNTAAPFSQLYAGFQTWGRYRLVGSPADADLVFEFSFSDPATTCSNEKTCTTAVMELAIYDAKTHFRLWTFEEAVDNALLTSNFVKNIGQTVATLISEVKLAAMPQ